jgi:uncharacterized membrane protein YgdD (TMEM256/DUF423 family)
MIWTRRTWMTLAAVSGLVSIIAGAFAAHGVGDPRAKELIETGARYQLMHALASFACATFMQAGAQRARFAPALFLSGTLLFSGSLYAFALGAPRWIGVITPLGGLLFMAGWVVLIWAARGVDAINITDPT